MAVLPLLDFVRTVILQECLRQTRRREARREDAEAPGAGEKKRRFARVVNGRARRAARTPPLWPSRELRVFAFAEGVEFCGGGDVKAPAYPFGTALMFWYNPFWKGIEMAIRQDIGRMSLLLCTGAPLLAGANPPVPVALPPVVHADSETVTNVPFTASLDAAGRFRLSLSCLATPSNNVEAAFGVDRNDDGVLALEETDCAVGWDCGAWFVRKGADGARTEHAGTVPADGISELSWSVQTSPGGAATRLLVAVDGAPAFADLGAKEPRQHELSAGWLYRREWNLVKLTGRGLEGHGEAFAVQVLPDAVVIRFR